MHAVCRRVSLTLVMTCLLLGATCSEAATGPTPAQEAAEILRGAWVSTDSVQAEVGAVGVLTIRLIPVPDAFGALGGGWELGDRAGDFYMVSTVPGDSIGFPVSDAWFRGAWSSDSIWGTMAGPVLGDPLGDEPVWNVPAQPVTLVRPN